MTKHISAFQAALTVHTDHVKSRQQRVSKYGKVNDSQQQLSVQEVQQNYALFGNKPFLNTGGHIHELRRRSNASQVQHGPNVRSLGNHSQQNDNSRNSLGSSILHPQQLQQQQQEQQQQRQQPTYATHQRKDQRAKNAEKVESSIMQVTNTYQLLNFFLR